MLTSQKGEVAVELLVFVGIMLMILVFFIALIGTRIIETNESRLLTKARNIVDTISNEINIASRIEGYYREFYLPERIDGDTYSIIIHEELRTVEILWDGKNMLSSFATGNITGSVKAGKNTIKNEGGVIKFES